MEATLVGDGFSVGEALKERSHALVLQIAASPALAPA
jgi:hypothetical protein